MSSNFFEDKVVENGVSLPVLNLKGKPYLSAAARILWFRSKNGEAGIIKTQMLEHQNEACVFRAEVYINDKLVATAHKQASAKTFPHDYIAKSETGAVSRALGLSGYNLLNDPDLDEGTDLSDAPVELSPTLQLKEKAVASVASVVNTKEVNTTATVARPSFRKKIEEKKAVDLAASSTNDDI